MNNDNENDILSISDADRAKQDAFADMQEEYDDLIPAYFGSATVYNEKTGKHRLVNLLITHVISYEEAVGMAFLQVGERFKKKKGWAVNELVMEDVPIWIDAFPPDEEDEFEPGELDTDFADEEAGRVEGAIDSVSMVPHD